MPRSLKMLIALVALNVVAAISFAQHSIPPAFVPVDTTRLIGSPDPLPLEAVRAFPKLQFERPVELTHAGDDSSRVFVVEQKGVIRVFENQEEVDRADVFLDLQDVVLREGNEEGLLGLAFHPRFKENGEFFVYYSTRSSKLPRASVISRFRVAKGEPNKADRSSEERLLVIPQPYENHNGGSMKFGPDGYLYIGLGDGGLADDPHSHGQNLETLLGSILRIDVDHKDDGLQYAVPKDNPFALQPKARGEIWAYGLRNVWRLAFDKKTGELFAGDVGQNRFEEVNRIVRGGNYGWNIREGFHPFEPNTPTKTADLLEPLATYFRGEGQSVTGGLVYRGPSLKGFDGAYFYGDYLSGNVWIIRSEGKRITENPQVARTGLQIAAFGEDHKQEMYLCVGDGKLYRLRQRDAAELKKEAAAFPRKLSETGLFASVKDNEPSPGVIPYEVNVPFWSDFAVKDRYLVLPKAASVTFDEKEKWQFPLGAVFVKSFWMHRDRPRQKDPVRLETRLFVHAKEGWVGYTYVYNEDQSEADLLDGSLLRPVAVKTDKGPLDQPYYFPSRSDCLTCHTKAEGFVLGLTTRQMNRMLNYRGKSENQLQMLDRLGVFANKPAKLEGLEKFPDWGFGNLKRGDAEQDKARASEPAAGPDGKTDVLARAWLEVNCAMCHRPEGIAAHKRDLRFHTPLEKMNILRQDPEQGQMTPPGSFVLKPGHPHQSELLIRMAHRGDRQMPPLATRLVDPHGLEVLRRWIAEMKPE